MYIFRICTKRRMYWLYDNALYFWFSSRTFFRIFFSFICIPKIIFRVTWRSCQSLILIVNVHYIIIFFFVNFGKRFGNFKHLRFFLAIKEMFKSSVSIFFLEVFNVQMLCKRRFVFLKNLNQHDFGS